MKKFFLHIILLIFSMKKVNTLCATVNYGNYKCNKYDYICKTCKSKNCKKCKICNLGKQINCESCKSNYYLDSKNDCMKKEAINNELDSDETDNEDLDENELSNNIICHPNCLNCSSFMTNVSMNCISCRDNLFKIYGTDDCYDNDLLNESFYFKNNFYYPCDDNCLTCTDEKNETSNNCLSCDNDNKELYLLEDINNCKHSDFSGYYLNNNTKILQKCFQNCKACKGPYEIDNDTKIENHNCIECADNYYKLPNNSNQNNCYDNDTINSLKSIETINLNINNTYTINIENIFNNLETTIKIDSTIPFENNNIEVETTLNMIKISSSQIEAISSVNFSNPKQIEFSTNYVDEDNTQLISLEEFQSKIDDNIIETMNISKFFNGSNFKAIILSSNNLHPKHQLDLGISAVDLGKCTQIIKEYYNISEDENLIVVNIELRKSQSKNDMESDDNNNLIDIGKYNQIEIYDFSGTKLNLSICKEDIKIMQYIEDIEELDIQSAINLAQIGIDVFNTRDDYFNDICHNYENSGGKDIIIKDRRADIYQNVSFCQKGCKYNGINYTLVAANCICNSNFLQSNLDNNNNTNDENAREEKLNFKELKKIMISSLIDFNIDVIFCYNLILNLKLLKKNIGFFCMIFLLLLQIVFFVIYHVKKLKSLKRFMLIFRQSNLRPIKAFPPFKKQKKTIKTNINEEQINSKDKIKFPNVNNNLASILNNDNKSLLKSKSLFSNKINKKDNLINENNFAPTINLQTPIININNNKILSNSRRIRLSKKNKISKFQRPKNIKSISKIPLIKYGSKSLDKLNIKENNLNNEIIKKKRNANMETIGNINKNKSSNIDNEIIKLSRGDDDLLDMDFEHAILYDKRIYLRMYWGILVDNQIILDTFCTENYLHLFIIKLSFMIFNFQINLFLNAFFYTDEYISDAYHNNGVLDFFTSLPKSIYSFIATLIITNLLKMLSNSKSELTRVIRNKRKDNNYIFFINNKLGKLRKKLIVYFILVFLLDLIFLYYVSVFCAVYHYSQKYWFFGFLESFGLDSLVAIFLCVFIALFRYIAIKARIKYFYTLANIIRALF